MSKFELMPLRGRRRSHRLYKRIRTCGLDSLGLYRVEESPADWMLNKVDQVQAFIVSAVFFQEDGGRWCAQCLEYDIAAQAETLPDLQYELERILFSHITVSAELQQKPFEGLEPAPRRFWEMYEAAQQRSDDRSVAPREAPFPFMIPVPTKPIAYAGA